MIWEQVARDVWKLTLYFAIARQSSSMRQGLTVARFYQKINSFSKNENKMPIAKGDTRLFFYVKTEIPPNFFWRDND